MTRAQRIARWEAIVSGTVADYLRLDAACDAAIEAGCMDPNGKLHDAIWRSFDSMLSRIDAHGWLAWHLWENRCGKRGHEARACGSKPLRRIRTARQLARLIVESESLTPPRQT